MVDFRILTKLVGGLLIIFSLLLCTPAVFCLFHDYQHIGIFLLLALCVGAIGAVCYYSQKDYNKDLNHRTGLAVVALAWITACTVGALPYYLSGTLDTFLDSLFESISGFSGTGASVLTEIEGQNKAVLLWRSLTQWMGGMGIIVFFIAILPILGIGGAQLFKAEVTGPQKDKITPRVRETAKKLWLLYVGFTVALAIALIFAGMSRYDAVNHALTTISTGGFSTKNSGIAAFNSSAIEYIITIFMVLSSINFSLHYRLLALKDSSVFLATELKWYIALLLGASLLITFSLWGETFPDFATALRKALFTVTCTASSTGFTNTDYTVWPYGPQLLIALLMIVGGMSGSTAGGMKCIRVVAAVKQFMKEIHQIVHPRAVYSIKANGQSIPNNIVNAIWGFLFLYLFTLCVITIILTFDGIDLLTASTAAASVLSNIGPALGELGPYDNYASLSALTKIALSAGMLLGRLEFYTILIIFTPVYWKH